MAWLYILSESHGALSYSFLFLEDYTKKLASETDNENSKNLALFPNTPHFIDYFAYLEKRLQQENNPRYYLKFDQFFSDFETKYTNSRIAPELLPIITAYREKYVAKANDIKEKLPGLIEEEREKLKQKILLRNEKLKAKEMERQMKLEEKRDEMQLAREKKQREKQDNKAKTVDELSDHPLDYTWVEMRKRKDKKKVVEDPITKEKKTVVVSNKKNEEFNSGVYYRR